MLMMLDRFGFQCSLALAHPRGVRRTWATDADVAHALDFECSGARAADAHDARPPLV